MATRKQPRLSITSIEGSKIEVMAQYNPKEISVDRSLPWTRSPKSNTDPPALDFSAAEGRSMSFELMFDTYEADADVHAAYVGNLMKLTVVDPALKRPPKIAVNWGNDKPPKFEGVIESVSTKYTMFLPDGTAVRATCQVRIREAGSVSVSKID